MAASFGIQGRSKKTGQLVEAEVLSHHDGEHNGVLALTDPLLRFDPVVQPFLNDTFGAAMNQNIAFGGTPEIIHNGGTSVEWTGSAIQGTWNFADAGKISLTSGNQDDEATFAEETPTTIDISGYTTLTGKINLTTYSGISNTLSVEFDNAGTPVGNSVLIDDYIDTGLIGTEQSFAIPKADLGLSTQLVDGFSILLTRTGGSKPTMTFDDIQLEETGEAAVFTAAAPAGTTFHVDTIRFSLVDNITGLTTVAGATENATMINLSYDQILGVASLSNGIIFRRVRDGVIKFSTISRQIGDFLAAGADIIGVMSDGTNACVTLDVPFKKSLVLRGGSDDNSLSLTISDDLSGLIVFTAAARGAIEV